MHLLVFCEDKSLLYNVAVTAYRMGSVPTFEKSLQMAVCVTRLKCSPRAVACFSCLGFGFLTSCLAELNFFSFPALQLL
jgi:hypothetical protein